MTPLSRCSLRLLPLCTFACVAIAIGAVSGCGGEDSQQSWSPGGDAAVESSPPKDGQAEGDAVVLDSTAPDAKDAASDHASGGRGGTGGGAGGSDAGKDGPVEEGAPGTDPCVGASLGDGIYCGGNLDGGHGDPDTLYECKASKTVTATPCKYGCLMAPNGVPDHCKPNPDTTPTGKGVWVWMFDTYAPSAAQVATEAKGLGIGFVLIKSGQNDSYYTDNFNATIVNEFTSKGIEVYGWPWIDPGSLSAKIDAAAQASNIPGVTGLVLDVEGSWESSSGAYKNDAIALCDGIRAKAPGKFLGFSSFGWLSYHTTFPFKEFDQHCGDAHLPQTYYVFWSLTPTQVYNQAVQQAQDMGLTAPIWAAQQNYGENGVADATVAEMNEFFDVAGPRSSLFRWPNPGDTAIRNAMNSLHWQN